MSVVGLYLIIFVDSLFKVRQISTQFVDATHFRSGCSDHDQKTIQQEINDENISFNQHLESQSHTTKYAYEKLKDSLIKTASLSSGKWYEFEPTSTSKVERKHGGGHPFAKSICAVHMELYEKGYTRLCLAQERLPT